MSWSCNRFTPWMRALILIHGGLKQIPRKVNRCIYPTRSDWRSYQTSVSCRLHYSEQEYLEDEPNIENIDPYSLACLQELYQKQLLHSCMKRIIVDRNQISITSWVKLEYLQRKLGCFSKKYDRSCVRETLQNFWSGDWSLTKEDLKKSGNSLVSPILKKTIRK